MTLNKDFFVAGRAVFTLEIPSSFQEGKDVKPHYTFKIRKKEADENWPEAFFVSLLTGPDNTSDFTYLGMLNPKEGFVKLTKKSCAGEDSWVVKLLRRTLQRVWEGNTEAMEAAGFVLHHEGKCGRCGRSLTTPESVERGIGPECIKILGG